MRFSVGEKFRFEGEEYEYMEFQAELDRIKAKDKDGEVVYFNAEVFDLFVKV